jgi:hypothetical protein
MLGFIRGKGGELRAGYQCAAKLGAWTARKDSQGNFQVDAQALEVNSHWIKYQPLELRLFIGQNRKKWIWLDVRVSEPGGLLAIATKGEPEK